MPAYWQTGNSPGMILVLESNFLACFITFDFLQFFSFDEAEFFIACSRKLTPWCYSF